MSEYRTNNKDVMVNAVPLFASSWLALFSVLRDNFYASRAITVLDEDLAPIKNENAEQVISD